MGYHRAGFDEIIGSFSSEFILGTPSPADFVGTRMHREAAMLYSPRNELLMVDVRAGYDKDLIANILIAETSFDYIRFNR